MIKIQGYVESQLEDLTSIELAAKLGVSLSMISAYKKSYNPSLAVAKKIYIADNIALHPYSESSLNYEINKDK